MDPITIVLAVAFVVVLAAAAVAANKGSQTKERIPQE